MKTTVHYLHTLTLSTLLIAAWQRPASANPATWTAVGADQNWSTPANWSNASGGDGGLNPGVDSAVFDVTTATNAIGAVDNIVDQDISIIGLTYSQTTAGLFHTTQIHPGGTVTVNGALTIGGVTADNAVTSVDITGHGTVLQTAGGLTVRNSGSTASSSFATNDMSSLDNFIYNVAGGVINIGTGQRGHGTLLLGAVSNNISAATVNVATGATTSGGPMSLLALGGGTNMIFADTMNFGADKGIALVQFQGSSGGLTVRNAAGTGGANMTIASRGQSGTAVTPTLVNLNGHPVDAQVNSLLIGKSSNSSTGAGGIAFDTGTISATTVEIGSATSGTGNGTNTVGSGGTFIIGTGGMKLGNRTGGTVNAIMNVTGGSVVCSNNITTTATSTTSRMILTAGGSLNMVNSGTLAVGTLAVSNSTLYLPPGAGGSSVNATVTTLALGGAGNTITVVSNATWDSTSLITTYPTTLHLIQFTTFAGDTNASPITLGPLPYLNGVQLTGVIVTNSGFIDLKITGGPGVSATTNVWVGAVGSTLVGDWDTSTLDWKDETSGNPDAFANLNFTFFNDAASYAAVNLTTALIPISTTVSNSSLAYVFSGVGKLSGNSSLIKQGSGSLVLTESGGDDFAGGVLAGGGSLVLSNTSVNIGGGLMVTNGVLTVAHSGNIAGGLTVNQTGSALLDQTGTMTGNMSIGAGASVQVGNNDGNGSLPSGTVANDGSLVFNQSSDFTAANTISGAGTLTKNNNNTLTLSANNNGYAGGATVNSGTLQVAGVSGNSGLGKGNTTVNTNAMLVGAGTDAFGFAPSHNSPATILINGGTVTTLGTSSYRVTLPNLTFIGGTLTSAPGNNGDATGGNYSFFGNTTCTVASLSNNTTAVISAGKISIQDPTTFDVAAGVVIGGASPGVDLLVSSVLANFNTTVRAVTKVSPGVLGLDANNTFTGGLTINNGTLQLGLATDVADLTSPLGGGAVIDNAVLNFASSQNVTVNNTITGTGSLVVNSGNAILGGADSYAGNTSVNAGRLSLVGAGMISNQGIINVASNATLDVSVRSDGTLTLTSGQTLSGAGTVQGILASVDGATVAPGSSSITGTLTITSDTTLAGTNTMKIDKANNTNDLLSVGGNLTYGGTLSIGTLSGTIALNDTFKLFNGVNYSGVFASIVPATPGAGLVWNTNNLTVNGTLSVSSGGGLPPAPTIQKISFAGGNLIISGTNNSGSGGTFSVLSSTNLLLPLTNWTVLTNTSFDNSGNFSVTNATGGNRQYYILRAP